MYYVSFEVLGIRPHRFVPDSHYVENIIDIDRTQGISLNLNEEIDALLLFSFATYKHNINYIQVNGRFRLFSDFQVFLKLVLYMKLWC